MSGWDGFMHGIKMCWLYTDWNQISLSSEETHACVLALIILSLYIDSKHCTACCPSSRIQTIHFDRHATIQPACQLFELHAFSDWVCSGKCIPIWIWHALHFHFIINMVECVSHDIWGIFYDSSCMCHIVWFCNWIKTCIRIIKTCWLQVQRRYEIKRTMLNSL